MRYEEVKELVNNIIKNDYDHIQEGRQYEFEQSDTEYIEYQTTAEDLYNKIAEILGKDNEELIEAYYTNMVVIGNILSEFYFKEGVKAGATNLNFAKKIAGYDIEGVI